MREKKDTHENNISSFALLLDASKNRNAYILNTARYFTYSERIMFALMPTTASSSSLSLSSSSSSRGAFSKALSSVKKIRGSRETTRTVRRKRNARVVVVENVTAKTALKEWSKTEKAIERGEQVLLFRKGGINDSKGSFQIKENQFVIFPTSFHSSSSSENDDDKVPDMKKGDAVPFSIVCRVTRAWQTSDKSVIKSLDRFHALREDEIISRVNYKPNEPYSILEVRAYVLPKDEFVLPADVEKYGGCKSWIEKLPFGIPDTTSLPPVLDQRDWLISQSDLKRKIDFIQATGVEIKELAI